MEKAATMFDMLDLEIESGWKLGIFGCPECKRALRYHNTNFYCPICSNEYPITDEVPTLISDFEGVSLGLELMAVKQYYLNERYDWTRDPKGFEYCYHHYRKWETWDAIKKHIEPEHIVLDVGCGTGLITNNLSRSRYRTVALDLNRWALCQMNGKPYVVKAQADVESLPIQDDSVDIVIATEVIEHLEQPEKTIGEMLRVCKSGGWIIGTVPSIHKIWKMRRLLSMTSPGNEPFHRNFSRPEIAELWREFGYKPRINHICLGLNWLWTVRKEG